MILQTGGMAQVLDHVPSKIEFLTLNPSVRKGEKGFSVSTFNSFQHSFFLGALILTTFSFSPKSHCNFCNSIVHVIYSVNNIKFSCSCSK
jgi:hypothetical protein